MNNANQEILEQIERANGEVRMTRYSQRTFVDPKPWQVCFSLIRDGVNLNVDGYGLTLDEAFTAAWGKLSPIVNGGGSVFLSPVVEHRLLKAF